MRKIIPHAVATAALNLSRYPSSTLTIAYTGVIGSDSSGNEKRIAATQLFLRPYSLACQLEQLIANIDEALK